MSLNVLCSTLNFTSEVHKTQGLHVTLLSIPEIWKEPGGCSLNGARILLDSDKYAAPCDNAG
jgi:hypothetical protein